MHPEPLLPVLLLEILCQRSIALPVRLPIIRLLVLAVLVLLGGGGSSILLLALRFLHDHDYAGRALRLGRGAELRPGRDEHVGDVVVLAQDGDVRDDVHRGDVAGDDDDAGEGGVAWCGGG
jgi:hypothetical protein